MPELLIAGTVATILMGAICAFFSESMRCNYIVEQRINQTIDIRRFGQELVYHAGRANQMYMYRSAVATDRSSVASELKISDDGTKHPAGDLIVFVYYEIPRPPGLTCHRIAKLVGYYLEPTGVAVMSDGHIGAVCRFTIDLSKNLSTGAATLSDQVAAYDTGTASTMVEKVMADNWGTGVHYEKSTFLLYARGLFETEVGTDTDARLFYWSDGGCLMVAGQCFGTAKVEDYWTKTDTFSFCVSPRS